MTEHDDAARAVAEARELIASGFFPGALDKLRTAVETLPAGRADVLVAQIRQAADDLAKVAPSYASAARAVRDSVAGRVGVPGLRARVEREEPLVYVAAESLATIALFAAILSLIGGIIGVVEAVRHHLHGNAMWVLIGAGSSVALWLSIAVGLTLLVDIGRTVGATSQ